MRKLILTALFAMTPPGAQSPGSSMPSSIAAASSAGSVLGPGGQIAVFVADLPDEFIDKTFRVDSSGDL